MIPTITLPMTDGVNVVVPDSLDLITPYVLQEQLDWFEDEIKFLRRLLKPGEKIIDIGANYGVYTLSMARTVQEHGHIWAFEPASSTAAFLEQSIAANHFTNITLEKSALSNVTGLAQFSINEHSELNAVVHGTNPDAPSETVPLKTLDQCMASYDWADIAFVKIDAEGEEENIIKGGTRFFAERSPLIQYEIKAGTEIHLDLVNAFAAHGYDSYRLVPGLDLLVPFDPQSPDPYLLNLFCCKPDRAARLAADGWLVLSLPAAPATDNAPPASPGTEKYDWRHSLATLPYGQHLAERWEATMGAADASHDLADALAQHARSHDASLPAAERFAALQTCFNKLRDLCIRHPLHLRRISFARVAQEFGARQLAVEALGQQLKVIFNELDVDISEPFLAPGKSFDTLPPDGHYGNWLVGGALETLEQLEFYSSFYKNNPVTERLTLIMNLGFGGEEMERRQSLTQRRFHTAEQK